MCSVLVTRVKLGACPPFLRTLSFVRCVTFFVQLPLLVLLRFPLMVQLLLLVPFRARHFCRSTLYYQHFCSMAGVYCRYMRHLPPAIETLCGHETRGRLRNSCEEEVRIHKKMQV